MTHHTDNSAKTRLKISSNPWEVFKQEALEKAGKLDRGQATGPDKLNFEDPRDIAKLLTEKRLELIRTVMSEDVSSIRNLAERLDRNVSDVHDDVSLLEEYGIIRFEEGEGRAKKPVVPYSDIDISVHLSADDLDGGDDESLAAAD